MPYDIVVGRTESDKELFGKEGLIYLGKGYVKMGQTSSLSNPILMDVARSHVVLISGKRGSGKCLVGDTLIPMNDGSLLPISEIADNPNKIFSLDEELKITPAEKSEFFEREANKILHIKLRSGREIKLTPEHPLMTIKGWKPAKELQISTRIATERRIGCFGREEMPEYQIKLLAYLIAEGHLGSGFVLFTNSDEKIVNEFFGCISEFDSNLQIKNHGKYGYRVVQKDKLIKSHEITRNNKCQFSGGSGIRYQKNSLRLWLEKIGLYGKSSLEKFIPDCVFKLPKHQLALFLNRLFCCDGSIYKHKTANGGSWQVSYCSSSERMIRQIQHLLSRFGILSRLRKKHINLKEKKFESFEIVIGTDNIRVFIQDIGFFGKKQERQIFAIEEIALIKRNPNVDTIPKEIWETYKPKNWADIGRAMNYKYPKAMRERIHYSPSRQTLLQIAEVEQSNPLRILAMSDIFWDEIVSIEMLEGNFKVYDICVPENHNFVANDIIVHNSYTLGVIAEEISSLPENIAKNIAVLIFDTMGIFWTMAYKNEKEKELLRSWEIEPKKIPLKIFVPFGYVKEYEEKGIPVSKSFALKVSELSADDWIITFGLNFLDNVAIAIQRVIAGLHEKEKDFDISDIIGAIEKDYRIEKHVKDAAINLFEGAETWGIFATKNEEGTEIKDIIEGGTTSILDLSCYSSIGTFNVRALVIGLVSKKLFNERMTARKLEEIQAVQHGLDYLQYQEKREMPLVWIVIDECLTGETEIITDKAHTPMQNIINKFENGEKIKVLGFDQEKNEFNHYDIQDVYKKGMRKIIKLITETGKEIKCTPEHRVLTSKGFASAFSADNIASLIIQHYSDDKKIIEVRILGHLFGDGWISDKTKSLGFSGKGNKRDLEKIKEDLAKLGFKSANIYERKTNSKINHNGKINIVNGTSQSFQSTDAYSYFRKLADFAGEKAINKTKIPEWLLNASAKEKAEFLAALMGADGGIISKAKNAKGDFNAIRLSFNKIIPLKKEASEYASQIKELFENLGVKISKISEREGNLRKDGNKTIKIVITLEKNIENIINFLDNIGYRYCSKKEIEGIKWSAYLRARLFLKRQREKIYEQALDLHKKGFGKTKIARQLNFPEAQIRDWIYNKIKPGLPKEFPDIEEWVQNRINENLLFEKIFKIEEIGKEEVYDISVDKVHNFVSNGFITHNCHEFLPQEGKTAATDALIQLLREGRQPGISLALATQQPGVIHHDALTQSDIVISHRVTAKPDVDALNFIMQTYLLEDIRTHMNNLPALKGSAIILDDNSERIYPMRVRPRFTWHGGEAPTAIKIKRRI